MATRFSLALRAGMIGLAALTSLTLAACGSGSTANTTVTGSTGVSSGVTLSLGGSSSSLLPSGTVTITATVTDDTANAGVSWSLVGEGALSNATTTTVTYTAPASVTGTSMPVITATANSDSTKTASTTLEVMGTPVLSAVQLFPAYVGIVYAARIVVAGGEASYTWSITSGTLPDGLTLGSSSTSLVVISGTPTTEGSYPVTLQVSDAESRVATVNLTFVVNAKVTCLLQGQYALLYAGFRDAAPAARVASLSIDSSGNVTGNQDFKSSGTVGTDESVTGTCAVTATNAGTFTLNATSGDYTVNHAVSADLTHGRVQLTSGGSTTTGTGAFYAQDSSAFSLATLAGDYAFGLLGSESDDTHLGVAGRLSLDASGNVTAAYVDRNGSDPLTNASATGTATAPDSSGRGTLSLNTGSETLSFVYYVVSANKLVLINGDTASNSVSLSGFMTRQSGSFGADSLDSSAVLSLWGAHGSNQLRGAAALGRLSGASSASGTLNLLLDQTAQGTSSLATAYTGAFSVDTHGYGAVTLTAGSTNRQLAVYLDGTSNGYVVEHGSVDNNAGLLEVQSGTFDNTLAGQFIASTQAPVVEGPLSLLPVVTLRNGIISATYASGYFYLDNSTGRGLGSLTTTAIGTDAIAFYELDASDVRVLRFGSTTARNPMIDWYEL